MVVKSPPPIDVIIVPKTKKGFQNPKVFTRPADINEVRTSDITVGK